ncbi:MAG: DUF5916 domain-containing protein [Maribacter sp.]|uniref:DUF5916 domain-containing protein n=1 Tax=Maribacter sp. TaxID=1897614 RepID=UPI003298A8FB
MIRTLPVLPILLFAFLGFGQENYKSFNVKYITDANVTPDGVLEEQVWEKAESANKFWEYFPLDSIQARQQSDIKMFYDDKNLYVGIRIDAAGKDYAIQSLKRDFLAGGNDNISVIFDTFNDGQNAFLFGTNPYGVLREALISGGSSQQIGFTTSWDVKWKGDAKIYDDYYTAEMIIPLSSFKFKEGTQKWRFNSYRFDTQSNEISTWIRIPQNQQVWGTAFMGDMIFEKPLGKSKTPLAIIPYVNAISSKNFETDEGLNDIKFGGDAKVAIGTGLNLDVTVNPDFSNVEVDDIVTNLTRFEIGLPEKRQFFIDNSDLFSSFGDSRDANPFFSRRIGIARDTAGNSIENPIIGGLRLSGKLSNNLRIGFLNIQTDEDLENKIASNNNTMIALQQKVFLRSNIGMYFINKQSFKDYDFIEREDEYNRLFGLDYNLASEDNTWTGKFYLHKSFQPDDNVGNLSSGARLSYNSRNYNFFGKGVYIDEDFSSDLGFIRRTGIFKGLASFERVFWPEKGNIQTHAFQFFPVAIWSLTDDFQNTDYDFSTSWEAKFRDTSEFGVGLNNSFTFLFEDFNPTGTDGGIPIPGNQGYHYNSLEAGYESDQRKVFAYSLGTEVGRFFNGNRFSLEGGMTLRFQPKVFISMLFNYDQISLPNPYPSADIWLISPKIDVTFSKSVFWSTLVQYSNQRDNLGVNSRLQWRFAPLSDLFIVYNDNYFVNQLAPRYRSINLKFTYWLNI